MSQFKEGDIVIVNGRHETVDGLGRIVTWNGEILNNHGSYYVKCYNYKRYGIDCPEGEDNHLVKTEYLRHATKLEKALV